VNDVQAVGPFRYKRKSWAGDFIAVLVMSTCLAVVGAKIGMLDITKEKLAQAVIERDFALDEQGRVEAALAELRQSLHGCLNGDGMTTTGSIEAEAELAALREELASVLTDWNALVKASGSPTNGGAVGHVVALKTELAALREKCDTLLADNYSLRAELEKRK
jgi:hypothetical protein